MRFLRRILPLLVLAVCTPALAQTSPCATLAAGESPAGESLRLACQFVADLPHTLPDFICSASITREMPAGFLPSETPDRNNSTLHSDLITAELTYLGGTESFTDLRVNGVPQSDAQVENSDYLWTSGEFATLLRGVFAGPSGTQFHFSSNALFHRRQAAIFSFAISQGNNLFWSVNSNGETTYPGVTGQLWLDPSTGTLLRFKLASDKLNRKFPLQSISHTIDFGRVALGDGSSFVLPVHAESRACRHDNGFCLHNSTSFTHYRRFRARGRLLPSPSP